MWAFCTATYSAKNHVSSHSLPLTLAVQMVLLTLGPQSRHPSLRDAFHAGPPAHQSGLSVMCFTTTHIFLQKLKSNDKTVQSGN